MGASILNTLTDLRTEIAEVLTGQGIKAIDYVGENIVPPVCVVVPADPYVIAADDVPFGHFSVGINVLIIGAKGTNKTAAARIDSMIVDVIHALEDWDITEVRQPMEVTLKGQTFMGSVITLEQTTKLEKEVM